MCGRHAIEFGIRRSAITTALMAAGLLLGGPAAAASFSLTSNADWNAGVFTSTNVSPPPPTGNGHVRLNDVVVTPFDHIWVSLSGRGTAVRINTSVDPTTIGDGNTLLTTTEAGGVAVMGEYYTAPSGRGRNPSRTTVDANGDVWVGNRDEGIGGLGSVAKISANPTGTTSNGLFGSAANGGAAGTFNALSWTNAGGVDNAGGTSTATDAALLNYVRTTGTFARHLSIDKDNNVWVGGAPGAQGGNQTFQLYNGATGAPIASTPGNTTTFDINRGGYGGLVDGNGVVWSAGLVENSMVRFDPATGVATAINNGRQSYGMGIDSNGKIWVSNWDYDSIQRFASDGTLEGTFFPGGMNNPRGVAVTLVDNNIWVANSYANTVSRLNNDGTLAATIAVGFQPTGVAVDSNGKVWVTNLDSNSVMRINPATNTVDLTIDLGPGASPYNYSDMTGTVLIGSTNPTGTWRRVLNGGIGATWDQIFWNTETEGIIPASTGLMLEARVSNDLVNWSTYQDYDSGDLIGLTGTYLELRATFSRTGGTSDTAILSDIQVDFTPGTVPVSVPGTLLLLGFGGLLLAWLRRPYLR